MKQMFLTRGEQEGKLTFEKRLTVLPVKERKEVFLTEKTSQL